MSGISKKKVSKSKIGVKCCQCGKLAIIQYYNKIPLCVNCYQKMAQADFMAQQANHNRLSWLAAHMNYVQQDLYASTGGILPLKQMQIPQPPSAGINYSYNNINVSDSTVGAISSGDLYAIDTSIEVISNQGETELAQAFKELSEAIIDSADIQNEIKKEILNLISYLSTEATQSKNTRNTAVINSVLSKLPTMITTASAIWSIWERIEPILKSHLGGG